MEKIRDANLIPEDKLLSAFNEINKTILSNDKDFALVSVKGQSILLQGEVAKAWHILKSALTCVFSEEDIKNKLFDYGFHSLKLKDKDTTDIEVVFKEGLQFGINKMNNLLKKLEKQKNG